MTPDLEILHFEMARMRYFEEALGDLWRRGLISGEMHLGVGEEAIAAGIAAHLEAGDGLALDYRPTPVLVGRGLDLESMLREMLGSEEGLCRGHGGHMHLLSPEHLALSTGIVGSTAPLGLGLALSAQVLRPGRVAIAVFGDGAANQGMVMESLNLARVWKLPVVFVCKDNGWAVTTRSSHLTAGSLAGRARAFGLPVRTLDGRDVNNVWKAAGWAIDRARRGRGPTFLLMRCRRPRGHFEDDQLVRAVRHPGELARLMPDLMRKSIASGAGVRHRIEAWRTVIATIVRVAVDQWLSRWDPLRRSRSRIGKEKAAELEARARSEIDAAVDAALSGIGATP
jgi:acetoin:2,6-dichlorophenolindophenol oxidoreductase subunit alpha